MNDEQTYLVVVGADGKPVHGGSRNAKDIPGKWTTVRDTTKMCKRGWHACTPEHLACWCYADKDEYLPIEVWECELENASHPDTEGKVVGARRRRTRYLGTLDAVDLRWLAADIACQTLHLIDDPRPGECILTIYEWCCGNADDADLQEAARAAAEAASEGWWTESRAASMVAAEAAAEAALEAASEAASRAASWAVAEAAASSRIILDYLETVRDEEERR